MYSLFLYFLWTTAHQRGTILSKCRKRKSELMWNECAAHHHHHSARLSTAWYVSSRIIMKNASVFLQDGQLHGTYVSGRIIMKNASTVQKFSPDRAKKHGSGNFIALQWGFFPLFWSNWSLVSLFVATMSRLLLWFGWRSIPLLALLFFFGCKPLNLKPTCF